MLSKMRLCEMFLIYLYIYYTHRDLKKPTQIMNLGSSQSSTIMMARKDSIQITVTSIPSSRQVKGVHTKPANMG